MQLGISLDLKGSAQEQVGVFTSNLVKVGTWQKR